MGGRETRRKKLMEDMVRVQPLVGQQLGMLATERIKNPHANYFS